MHERIGIMGGTFDPIHIGHLATAEQAREAFGLDAVVFVPAGNPVFKKDRAVTPAADRLAMCRLAVASNPAFCVSAMEIERGGDTYTVDTLRALRDAGFPVTVGDFALNDSVIDLRGGTPCDQVVLPRQLFASAREEPLLEGLMQVVEALGGLPAHKLHCSVLAEESIKSAIKNYYDRNGIEYDHSRFPDDCGEVESCRMV